MAKMNHRLTKHVALLTIFAFFISNSGIAALGPHPSAQINKTGANAVPARLEKLVSAIPRENAFVREVYDAGAKTPAVVLIKDTHENLSAQKNIRSILFELIRTRQVNGIAIEGAFGPVDVQRFRAFPNKPVIKKVLDYYLEHDLLSAPSVAVIASDNPPPPLIGVDDAAHYVANVHALLAARKQLPTISFPMSDRLTFKLVNFILTPKDWREYQDRKLANSHPRLSNLAPFENFYREADARSEKMVENLLRRVHGNAVLIAGGFHTPAIASKLRLKRISYAIVAPRIATKARRVRASYLRAFVEPRDFLCSFKASVENTATAAQLAATLIEEGAGPNPLFPRTPAGEIVLAVDTEGEFRLPSLGTRSPRELVRSAPTLTGKRIRLYHLKVKQKHNPPVTVEHAIKEAISHGFSAYRTAIGSPSQRREAANRYFETLNNYAPTIVAKMLSNCLLGEQSNHGKPNESELVLGSLGVFNRRILVSLFDQVYTGIPTVLSYNSKLDLLVALERIAHVAKEFPPEETVRIVDTILTEIRKQSADPIYIEAEKIRDLDAIPGLYRMRNRPNRLYFQKNFPKHLERTRAASVSTKKILLRLYNEALFERERPLNALAFLAKADRTGAVARRIVDNYKSKKPKNHYVRTALTQALVATPDASSIAKGVTPSEVVDILDHVESPSTTIEAVGEAVERISNLARAEHWPELIGPFAQWLLSKSTPNTPLELFQYYLSVLRKLARRVMETNDDNLRPVAVRISSHLIELSDQSDTPAEIKFETWATLAVFLEWGLVGNLKHIVDLAGDDESVRLRRSLAFVRDASIDEKHILKILSNGQHEDALRLYAFFIYVRFHFDEAKYGPILTMLRKPAFRQLRKIIEDPTWAENFFGDMLLIDEEAKMIVTAVFILLVPYQGANDAALIRTIFKRIETMRIFPNSRMAMSNFHFGILFFEEDPNPGTLFLQTIAHEMGHNFLYYFGLSSDLFLLEILHERMADLLTIWLSRLLGIKVGPFLQTVRSAEHHHTVQYNNHVSIESHEAARAIHHILEIAAPGLDPLGMLKAGYRSLQQWENDVSIEDSIYYWLWEYFEPSTDPKITPKSSMARKNLLYENYRFEWNDWDIEQHVPTKEDITEFLANPQDILPTVRKSFRSQTAALKAA